MTAIYVCPLSALDETLAKSRACSMVSLTGPGKESEKPATITGDYLQLAFNDIAEKRDGLIEPTQYHVQQLIDFARQWDQRTPVLVQCWMGVSRSTAACAIILATVRPGLQPLHLAQMLRLKSPVATPNPLMIKHADDLLNFQGSLIAAIAKIGRGAETMEGIPFFVALDEVGS